MLEIIFSEFRQSGDDSLTFKDLLSALSAYKIDMNNGRAVTKEEYMSMSKFLWMQICQQAELSIHLSQYKDKDQGRPSPKSVRKSGRTVSPSKQSARDSGNPLFETGS